MSDQEKRWQNQGLFISIIVSLSLLVGCAVTGPEISKKEEEREAIILKQKARLYKLEQQRRIMAVGVKILEQIPNPPEIIFKLDDSEMINAYVTNEIVAVTRGMMRFVKSEDELAVVLGHEIAHVTRNHILKRTSLTLSAILLEKLAGKEGTYRAVKGLLPIFDRDQEREADYFGLIYAYKAGYDPTAGVDIWERISVEVAGSMTKDFFDSHPWSPERMLRAKETARALTEGRLNPGLALKEGFTLPRKTEVLAKLMGYELVKADLPDKIDEIYVNKHGKTIASYIATYSELEKAIKLVNQLEKGSPYLEEKEDVKLLAVRGKYKLLKICITRGFDKLRVAKDEAIVKEYFITDLEEALKLFYRLSQ